ncbi:hypothetical protein BOW53_12370 [Solemya pervernicosa gill symbiont]|uniref:Uncharacterized protein n=1 Tax=Solemya pervernicosa gill symbiont TaxID=642797 RepID=A0A1T2L2C3_9GAMM|nr:hypothetical protein [Solemya pervernicosa gill symbiont]OOZ39247.1 hypothetical protein BOW53_12370 [Solemya pervernicosa gill symbiont]
MKKIVAAALPLIAALTLPGLTSAAGYETKDQWSAKIKSEKRITAALCAPEGYLVSCTTPYTETESDKPVQTSITAEACTESVDYLTKAMLHDGKADHKPAMFYHKLPSNIGAGYQMDHFASELGKNIFGQISGILQQKGGSLIRKPSATRS